jgi:hypothetical protein
LETELAVFLGKVIGFAILNCTAVIVKTGRAKEVPQLPEV